ncbi:MAG TPA: hypothetical protein VK688_07735 [Gemmatimonadales bacterium]|jgi:hypothetical protein|nr:hypothetical protein [Gemmatimonadales bacterium]
MSDEPRPIQVPLTPEQQALIRRLSGQHAEILELTPEAGDPSSGAGEGLRFRWRLSLSSGIPRQSWGFEDKDKPKT